MLKDIHGSVIPAAHHNIGKSLSFFVIFCLELLLKINEETFEELDEKLV